MGEGGLGAGLAGGLEEVEGADGVGVEVVEGNGGGAVVAGLGGGVDDGVGFDRFEEVENALAVADVELVVGKGLEGGLEPLLVPAGIALFPEENGALVVVDPVEGPAFFSEKDADFRTDEAGGSGDEEAHGKNEIKLKIFFGS